MWNNAQPAAPRSLLFPIGVLATCLFLWPRTEDPGRIIADIVAGIDDTSGYTTIIDRRRAIVEAVSMAQAQDAIVIAGKGHEDYQIIGQTRLYFDDRDVAHEAVKSVWKTPSRWKGSL